MSTSTSYRSPLLALSRDSPPPQQNMPTVHEIDETNAEETDTKGSTTTDAPAIFSILQKRGLVPSENKAGWSHYLGTFCSNKYPQFISRGNVYIHLPDDFMSLTEPVTLQATLEYKGLYRINELETIPVKMSAGGRAETDSFITRPFRYQDKTVDKTEGRLEFTVEKVEGDSITGKYVLAAPYDNGSFVLKKNGYDTLKTCIIS